LRLYQPAARGDSVPNPPTQLLWPYSITDIRKFFAVLGLDARKKFGLIVPMNTPVVWKQAQTAEAETTCACFQTGKKVESELIGGYRMTRIVTTAAVILILIAAIGCTSDTGISQRLPQRSNVSVNTPSDPPLPTPSTSNEIDLVEQMSKYRQEYRRSLQALIQHYDAMGNHEKTMWAKQEVEALDRIPQYRYITTADMPENLKATERIPAADQLYEEAEKLRRDAGVLPVLKDEEYLRAALDKYNQLIREYPSSDKIDDAAFRMGEIHENFRDYTLALTCYQRAYQWDASTPYPARFKAASVLDRRLHRRAEALQLYQEAIVKESQFVDRKLMAEQRIKELTTSTDTTTK